MKITNNYMIKFLAVIIKIASLPFYLVNFFIPKNEKIWVFGSCTGKKYNENSKALFEYVSNKKEVRAIWLTKSDKVYNNLIKRGYECYRFISLKGIYLCLIAKVAVISVSYFDVPRLTYLFPWKLKIVNLWHGTPLKKLTNKHLPKRDIFLTEAFRLYLTKSFDIIISATPLNRKIYSELFRIKERNIKITGQPRNDLIFIENLRDKSPNRQKIILYLPTWREYDTKYDLFFQNGFNVKKINKFLKKINAKLLIKLHVLESTKSHLNWLEKNERIEFIDIDDVYEILSKTDILITDYSSVYFDFLLLNRPIIFAPFDFDTYNKKRGFYYDYKEVTPGPKAKNWADVMEKIKQIIEKDTFKKIRELTNAKFNYWRDGKNSERVYKEIVKLIKKNDNF